MGYLFRPKYPPEGKTFQEAKADGSLRESAVWWAQYSLHGRRVRESTRATEKHEAIRFLRAREGRVAAGQPVLPRVERIRHEEVAEDLRRDYQTTGRRDLAEAEHRLRTPSSGAGSSPT